MALKKICILIPVILLLFISPAAAREPGKLVMIIADNLSIYDLTNYELKNIKALLQHGSLGLLNTNTAGKSLPENTYTTIATGNRALGSSWTGKAFHYAELLPEVTNNRAPVLPEQLQEGMGTTATRPDEIANVGIYQLQNYNSNLKYSVEIGALGELIRSSGLETYVIGNADTLSETRRFAAMLTLDKFGSAGEGVVNGEVLTPDEQFPFGLRTDYAKLSEIVSEVITDSDFIVLETGDMSRLEEYKSLLAPAKYQQARMATLQNLDLLIGRVSATINPERDLLILVAPTPNREEAALHNTLTPLIFYGKDVEPGILTSASTRRSGIITNTDLAPTIAHFFALNPPASFIGRPIYSQVASDNLATLTELNTRLVSNYNHRPVVLKTYVIMQIVFILSAVALVLLFKNILVSKLLNLCILYFLVSTYLLIVFKLFQMVSPALSLVIYFILGIGLATFVYSLPLKGITKIQGISLLTSLTLLADLSLGLGLMQNSPLGYDPIIGARFYGLGNELAGVLMGSTLLSTPFFFRSSKVLMKMLGIAFLCVTALIIFLPQLGADVGGLITATISFGYLVLRLQNKKSPAKLAIILPAATLVLLMLVVSGDFYLNKEDYSHMALTVSTIKQAGMGEALNIITRKVNMNIKLLNYSIWTKALLSFILAFAVLLARPRGFILRLKQEDPTLYQAFGAILIASVFGLLVNDSGIIQAATTFIYLIFPLLYLTQSDSTFETSEATP